MCIRILSPRGRICHCLNIGNAQLQFWHTLELQIDTENTWRCFSYFEREKNSKKGIKELSLI